MAAAPRPRPWARISRAIPGLAKITEPGKWPHVEMGHSDDIKPGTWCMALGHPGGIQQGRTPPIRLGRVLNAGKGARFLVTDATVISGDSGGPLFDLEGRVIGVHSNIGMNVNQNQHVPIDVYREQWNDLLAGKAIGTPADLHAGNMPNPEKLKRFRELLLQRLMAGDPEVRDLMQGRPPQRHARRHRSADRQVGEVAARRASTAPRRHVGRRSHACASRWTSSSSSGSSRTGCWPATRKSWA